MSPSTRFIAWIVASAAVLGCDKAPERKQAAAEATAPPSEPAPKPVETPETAPDLVIDAIGPKVGFFRAAMQYPDGRAKLGAELQAKRQHFEGKEARLVVDRKAKPEWVDAYLGELANIGVSQVLIRTETRSEYPAEVRFTPESKVQSPAPCSAVAMILEDRGTAVWKISGGVAGKRAKGMAGPDLTMTGETIERIGKSCKNSSLLFVAGAPAIEWGLVYDLAASAQTLESVRFESRVLLSKVPVPGHQVTLRP